MAKSKPKPVDPRILNPRRDPDKDLDRRTQQILSRRKADKN